MKEGKIYSFSGAVTKFGVIVCSHWEAETFAPTKAKATSNLKYQFKKKFGLTPQVPIELIGSFAAT